MTKISIRSERRIVTQKAQREDIPAIVRVLIAAFRDNAINHVSAVDEEEKYAAFVREAERAFDEPALRAYMRAYKAVNVLDGSIVGSAWWAAFKGDEHQSEVNLSLFATIVTLQTALLSGSSYATCRRDAKDLNEELSKGIHAAQKKWIYGKPYLALVGVAPEHQGHGIGEMLVQVGMDEADERRVPCFLIASHAGYPVYRRMGWVDAGDVVELDLNKIAGDDAGYGIYRYHSMLRLPGPSKSG